MAEEQGDEVEKKGPSVFTFCFIVVFSVFFLRWMDLFIWAKSKHKTFAQQQSTLTENSNNNSVFVYNNISKQKFQYDK